MHKSDLKKPITYSCGLTINYVKRVGIMYSLKEWIEMQMVSRDLGVNKHSDANKQELVFFYIHLSIMTMTSILF